MTTRDYLRWFWRSLTGQRAADPTERLREQLAAANSELARATKRADLIDATLDAMRQQAIEAVKERNAANERAKKAEARLAEHKPGPVLRAWRGDNGDIIHGDKAWIRQAIRTHGGTHVIADTCTWVSGWREAETADATAGALSATETDAEGAQAREDANSSSILPQGLSEPGPCRSCAETYCDDSREAKR